MLYKKLVAPALLFCAVLVWSCQSDNTTTKNDDTQVSDATAKEEMVNRGRFLIQVGGCTDCHSPKIMTAQGPVIDSSKMFSGHPAGMPLPPVIGSALQPGNWVLMSPDITAFVGPWGISYSANLTSDSATGIGAWTEEQFVQTLRTGRHLGMENGRPVLPPMPWEPVGKLPEDDLKAMLAYLKSTPAISNRVPGPVPPDKVPVAK